MKEFEEKEAFEEGISSKKEGKSMRFRKSYEQIEELSNKIEELTNERDQYLSGWQRERAEFENFRKRLDAEKEEIYRFVKENTAANFLDVVDNLERALNSAKSGDEIDAKILLSGVEMVYKQLLDSLKKCDVTSIEAEGEMFDPNLHEAVQTEIKENLPEGTITRELRKGYKGSSRTLRPSMVIVSKQS